MNREKGLLYLFIVGVGLSMIQYPYINDGINNILNSIRFLGTFLTLIAGLTLIWLLLMQLKQYITKRFLAAVVIVAFFLFMIYVASEMMIF